MSSSARILAFVAATVVSRDTDAFKTAAVPEPLAALRWQSPLTAPAINPYWNFIFGHTFDTPEHADCAVALDVFVRAACPFAAPLPPSTPTNAKSLG